MLTERSQLGAVAGWYISPESLQKGYDPGIDDYMVKSGDFSGLLMRVRALLRRANIEASRKLSVDGLLLYADALTASLAGAGDPRDHPGIQHPVRAAVLPQPHLPATGTGGSSVAAADTLNPPSRHVPCVNSQRP